LTKFSGGSRVIFYHLKVSNSRRWATAKNCRVVLKEIYRRGPDQQFHQVPLPVPVQFVWAPSEFTPPMVNISSEQVMDFGYLSEGSTRFTPTLVVVLNDFKGFVAANECVRFALQIVADGYLAQSYQVFEVAWDGKWNENLEEMENSLRIRELNS
jgi:hypothetical protein